MKKVTFLHDQVRLQMGLCFENLNDTAKAEEMYNKAKENKEDTTISKTAEKYLRSMQMKTAPKGS
jgi:hypothetical protein